MSSALDAYQQPTPATWAMRRTIHLRAADASQHITNGP
jgi:hypothetical protein